MRFTPTGVGTIATATATTILLTVHPHGRGDNEPQRVPGNAAVGSPPRAWGQCGGLFAPLPDARFTPTGVGTMNPSAYQVMLPSVHPHGRGDNAALCFGVLAYVGSPPRAWGQFRKTRPASPPARFTPTGVGTILSIVNFRDLRTVHPHGRGDNQPRDVRRQPVAGSPPRAWGQFRQRVARHRLERFTPTGVGTIVFAYTPNHSSSVHPHGRGDNYTASSRDIFGCSKNRQNRIVENSTYPLDDFGFR